MKKKKNTHKIVLRHALYDNMAILEAYVQWGYRGAYQPKEAIREDWEP